MGELLPNSTEVEQATAPQVMDDFLYEVEKEHLSHRPKEWVLRKFGESSTSIIDISSASSMKLFWETETSNKLQKLMTEEAANLVATFEKYPSLMEPNTDLQRSFCNFFNHWSGSDVKPEEVAVFSGVYGSYRTILMSKPGSVVIVPEFIHDGHKACFAALGKTVVEIPVQIYTDNLLDLQALEETLKLHKGNVAALYVYHTKSVQLPVAYLSDIGKLLKQYCVTGLFDMDVWYTAHSESYNPLMPFRVPELQETSLFLFNLTKEIGAPGLRIGFVVGSITEIECLNKFKQITLEMMPPINTRLAQHLLSVVDLNVNRCVLQERMQTLVEGLGRLGFASTYPVSGVNYFLHVPPSFEQGGNILPDHLFAYYVLTRAKVLVRPASSHGHRLNHFIRFVISQPVDMIEEVVYRFEQAGISVDMEMPPDLPKEYTDFIKERIKAS